MKLKRFLTWQFFIIAFPAFIIGLILGSTLSLFLYLKNIDVADIKKDHDYLEREYEMLRKKQTISDSLSDYVDKAKSMEDYNENRVVVPEEVKNERD